MNNSQRAEELNTHMQAVKEALMALQDSLDKIGVKYINDVNDCECGYTKFRIDRFKRFITSTQDVVFKKLNEETEMVAFLTKSLKD